MPSGFNGVGLEDNGHSERKGTVLTASFHILTTLIGYGILSLPRATAQLGWITGPALILLFAFVPYYTSTLLSACYRSGNEHCGQRTSTYIDVARSNLGVTTLLYMLSGCFGYAAFGESARESFLDGFVKPHWLLKIANAAIVLHLICSYQAYCQPLFAFVEKTAAQKYPDSQFITRNFEVPMPGSGTYKLNLFRSIWRTMFVIITTVVAMTMRLTFFKDAISFLGAWGFWPLTVHFPVEIYIEQKQIIKWSREWIWLQMLSFVCLIVTIAAVVGSIAGIVLDF
ncbi:Amino acid permease [Melia azedarach]|uniref:Amino acid permease n=1 Tax=Melia azedarach TaxID=155640 RepID=A0ACC1WPB0_MELAZ|nr:Amino acid permease [Melia azedarach]